MEKRKLVTPDDIRTALKDIGVQKGQVVMVHTFSDTEAKGIYSCPGLVRSQ